MKTVREVVAGREVELETFDGYEPAVARDILRGETYPILSVVPEVRTILDVGANVGATSVLFACHYPDATVHAFEPAPGTFEVLARNVAPFPNVRAHPVGLFDEAGDRPLYHGQGGPGQASINPDWNVRETYDVVRLEDAGSWVAANGIDRVDILKVDTEGCEVPILRSLGRLLGDVRVVYLEAHSERDWRELDAMLAPTHAMAVGRLFHFVRKWELAYVRRDVAEQVESSLAAVLAAQEQGGGS